MVHQLLVLIDTSVLVLLVLENEILKIGLGLAELNVLHTLASVPVQERLALEHDGKLARSALK